MNTRTDRLDETARLTEKIIRFNQTNLLKNYVEGFALIQKIQNHFQCTRTTAVSYYEAMKNRTEFRNNRGDIYLKTEVENNGG